MSDPGSMAVGSTAADRHDAGGFALALTEVTLDSAWNVQGDPGHSPFAAEVRRLFDIDLPRSPNTSARSAALTAYWLGPTSWLLVGASSLSPIEFIPKRDALNATGGALFDVSASRVAYRVQGARASDVLAAGCPLDFDAGAFPVGACQQSVLFRVAALIEKYDETPSYTLFIARSFAGGVWKALCLSAAEHGYESRPRPPDV